MAGEALRSASEMTARGLTWREMDTLIVGGVHADSRERSTCRQIGSNHLKRPAPNPAHGSQKGAAMALQKLIATFPESASM